MYLQNEKWIIQSLATLTDDWNAFLERISKWLWKNKKQVESFCVPSKWAKSVVQHGLFSPCPVTFCSSSGVSSSCAVSIHSALTPVQPWLCSAGSDPDKLLCLQAALSPAPNISSYFYPIPWRGVCLSPNTRMAAAFHLQGHWTGSHEGHSCEIITSEDWAQVYIAAKQPLHHHWGRWEGGTWASPTLDISIGCLGNENVGETSIGCRWLHGGPTSLHITLQ